MIDYIGNSLGSYLWKTQKAIFPIGGENIDYTLGIRNTYIKDNQYSQDLVNWLYDKAENSNRKKNSDKTNMDKAITAKMDSNMTSFYSNYNKLSKNEPETDKSRLARQTVLDMIYEYQKADDSGALTPAQEAVYSICKAEGTT